MRTASAQKRPRFSAISRAPRTRPSKPGWGSLGWVGLWLAALLGCLCSLAVKLVDAAAIHLRIEHFQGSAAGVDLIVMSEVGEAFEHAEQLLVRGASPDLYLAGSALRTERTEPGELVATFWSRRDSETAEGVHQVKRLSLTGLPRIPMVAEGNELFLAD